MRARPRQPTVRPLLSQVARDGASVAYLQCEAGNAAARRLYHRLGFVGYAYHYRLASGVDATA